MCTAQTWGQWEPEPNDPITHHARALEGPATEEEGEMEVEMQSGDAS